MFEIILAIVTLSILYMMLRVVLYVIDTRVLGRPTQQQRDLQKFITQVNDRALDREIQKLTESETNK